MKALTTLFVPTLLGLIFFTCTNSTSNQDETIAIETQVDTATQEKEEHVTAKFIEFSLGDASHYIFEDETGKTWDFAGNEDPQYSFAEELPLSQADESNQGWGSDKALQGKWFNLTYVYRTQLEYPDGPMASVPIIISAKLKE